MGEQSGIDRRTLIKRAGAAGAVAWTAPVILGSLTSPAAALTCGGCFRFQIVSDFDCFRAGGVAQTEGVSTISPCGTLSAAGCTSPTNVPAGAPADDFQGGVCTDIPGFQLDCKRVNVTFGFSTSGSCTWGGGGPAMRPVACWPPRRTPPLPV